jgi:uncharacterized cupredoxin-like copper-binding protein
MRRGPRSALAAGMLGLAAVLLAAGLAAGRTPAVASPPTAVRTIHITIHFSSFDTGQIDVVPGETVRFVIDNTDPIDHEFILGDDLVQQIHELGTEAVHPPKPGEVSVPAGTTATTTYTFGDPGELTFACHLPGHYAYGMHGTVTIG